MSQLDPWKEAADIIQKQMDDLRAQLATVTRERDAARDTMRVALEVLQELVRDAVLVGAWDASMDAASAAIEQLRAHVEGTELGRAVQEVTR